MEYVNEINIHSSNYSFGKSFHWILASTGIMFSWEIIAIYIIFWVVDGFWFLEGLLNNTRLQKYQKQIYNIFF